jgi:hypothetical protein
MAHPTADNARAEAKRILGMVATGLDPAKAKASRKTALTVAGLCDVYEERTFPDPPGDPDNRRDSLRDGRWGVNPKALSIVRLLALSGARRGEIVSRTIAEDQPKR